MVNIGVRIEDDILITDSLPENLFDVFLEVRKIEKMMKLELLYLKTLIMGELEKPSTNYLIYRK